MASTTVGVALAGGLALAAAGPASAKPPVPVTLKPSQLAAACARLHGALFPPEMCVLPDGRVVFCNPGRNSCTVDARTTPAPPTRPEVTAAPTAAVAAAG